MPSHVSPNADQVNNPVLKISREHDLIVEQLGDLERILAKSSPAEALPLLSKAMPGFAEALYQHFFYEERIFYPALAITIPTAGICERIQQLQKEHGIMEERLRFLMMYFRNILPGGETMAELIHRELSGLVGLVKRHAIMEITDVFPRINQNPQCLRMVLDLAKREAERAGKNQAPEV